MQTSITRVQFRKDLAGSLWVDGVQSSCFFRFVERLKRARKWVSGALRNHRPCLMNRFVIFYVSAPRKNSLPFRERPSGNLGRRVNGAFYRGHYRKLDCFTPLELVQNCFNSAFQLLNYPINYRGYSGHVICLDEDYLIIIILVEYKREKNERRDSMLRTISKKLETIMERVEIASINLFAIWPTEPITTIHVIGSGRAM